MGRKVEALDPLAAPAEGELERAVGAQAEDPMGEGVDDVEQASARAVGEAGGPLQRRLAGRPDRPPAPEQLTLGAEGEELARGVGEVEARRLVERQRERRDDRLLAAADEPHVAPAGGSRRRRLRARGSGR